MERQAFINTVKDGAIIGMTKYGILASLTIAQAILESSWGSNTPGNNLFGIKWTSGYASQLLSTREYLNHVWRTVFARFRKYNSWADSLTDHALYLKQNSRYANLIGVKDYRTVCTRIKQDGYATDPTYTNQLISLIEQNNLQQYDVIVKNGWLKENNAWYFYVNGAKVINVWKQDASKKWFFLGLDGSMVTNAWEQDKSKQWFYLGSDGAMVTNKWEQDHTKKWFYLGSDGAMATNYWVHSADGKQYYVGTNGAMVVSTTIDGWVVGPDGAWDGKAQIK